MASNTIAEQMKRTNRIFEDEVVGQGNFSALERVYTAQARILPPGTEMITGRDQIQAFWRAAAAALAVKSIELQTVDVEMLGETANEIGRAILVSHNAPAPVHLKYIVIWKLEDGAWKWHVDIWNSSS